MKTKKVLLGFFILISGAASQTTFASNFDLLKIESNAQSELNNSIVAVAHVEALQVAIPKLRVLVYHETAEYRHASIDAGIKMIQAQGKANNWTVTVSQFSNVFTTAKLANFDVVVFLNTSGNKILTLSEQRAFEAFIKQNKGFVGVHAATDTYRDRSWPWYNNLVGAIVQDKPKHTANSKVATMDVTASHPIVSGLGKAWTGHRDEYYYWSGKGGQFFSGNKILLKVRSTGTASYDAARGAAWYKNFGGGRSFYTSLGHHASDYQNDTKFINLIKNAIKWAGTKSTSSKLQAKLLEQITGDHVSVTANVFPNPVKNGSLTVDLSDASVENTYNVVLYSLNGSICLSQTINQPSTAIEVSKLKNGTYILKIEGSNYSNEQKIIINQ